LLDLANAETRVIPGTGPVQTRASLQAQFDMLTTLRERFAKMMRQGMSANDMLAAGVTKEFDEKWGDPKLFVQVRYRGLWLHVRELVGFVWRRVVCSLLRLRRLRSRCACRSREVLSPCRTQLRLRARSLLAPP